MANADVLDAFENGIAFPDYHDSMDTLKWHMTEQYQATAIPADVAAAFAAALAAKKVNRLLVLTEDYCPDSVLNLPIARRLEEAIPGLTLRIVYRGMYDDLAERYPAGDGFNHIPTLIFINESGDDVAVWHERPRAAHALQADFVAANPQPPRKTDTGETNPAFKVWMKNRLEIMKQAYRDSLWQESVREWQALPAG